MAFIYSHETHHLFFSLRLTLCCVLFSSLFCFCRSHEKVHSTSSVLVQQQREFDYFLLALQWPGTACQHTQRCCPSNGCCKSSSSPVGFTIHGLWANYNDGSWPSCCSESSFDIKEIQPLLDGLQKYWPSFRCGSTRTCNGGKGIFWAHEWEKHGTCSTSVLRDEYTFFLTTINLYLKYNITEILTEAGYPPSNVEKYPLGGVVSAIENAVRATPELVCSSGAIKELHICFYKDFKPRDCNIHGSSNGHMLASSSCPSYISIPEFVPSGLESDVSVPWIPSDEAM